MHSAAWRSWRQLDIAQTQFSEPLSFRSRLIPRVRSQGYYLQPTQPTPGSWHRLSHSARPQNERPPLQHQPGDGGAAAGGGAAGRQHPQRDSFPQGAAPLLPPPPPPLSPPAATPLRAQLCSSPSPAAGAGVRGSRCAQGRWPQHPAAWRRSRCASPGAAAASRRQPAAGAASAAGWRGAQGALPDRRRQQQRRRPAAERRRLAGQARRRRACSTRAAGSRAQQQQPFQRLLEHCGGAAAARAGAAAAGAPVDAGGAAAERRRPGRRRRAFRRCAGRSAERSRRPAAGAAARRHRGRGAGAAGSAHARLPRRPQAPAHTQRQQPRQRARQQQGALPDGRPPAAAAGRGPPTAAANLRPPGGGAPAQGQAGTGEPCLRARRTPAAPCMERWPAAGVEWQAKPRTLCLPTLQMLQVNAVERFNRARGRPGSARLADRGRLGGAENDATAAGRQAAATPLQQHKAQQRPARSASRPGSGRAAAQENAALGGFNFLPLARGEGSSSAGPSGRQGGAAATRPAAPAALPQSGRKQSHVSLSELLSSSSQGTVSGQPSGSAPLHTSSFSVAQGASSAAPQASAHAAGMGDAGELPAFAEFIPLQPAAAAPHSAPLPQQRGAAQPSAPPPPAHVLPGEAAVPALPIQETPRGPSLPPHSTPQKQGASSAGGFATALLLRQAHALGTRGATFHVRLCPLL